MESSAKVLSIFLIIILLGSSIQTSFLNLPQQTLEHVGIIKNAYAASDDIRQIGSYSIFGLKNIVLETNVTVTNGSAGVQNASPNMQLPANAEINIGSNSRFADSASAVAADDILVSNGTTIQNAYYNQLQNSGTVLGSKNTPLQLPLFQQLPPFPHSTPGTTAVNVPASSSSTLAPGRYGSISIGDYGILHMTGGIYNVTSITTGKSVQLLFDAPSQVIVQNQMSWKKGSVLGPSTSSLHAHDIVIFVGGNATINQNTTDTDFGKNAIVKANIYAPTGTVTMERGTIATGAFIANSIVIKQDSVISHDSAFDRPHILANEYLQLIEKLNDEGSNLNQVTIDQVLVDQINSDLGRLKEIVIELQNLGFDGQANATRVGQHMVGTVSFASTQNSELLFETQIPDGVLGIFAIMGLNAEYSAGGVTLSFDQLTDLLHSSQNITGTITNFHDDQIASNFVLASIAEFHPSTGHTFLILIAIIIIEAFQACLENPECEAAVTEGINEATIGTLHFMYPIVNVYGLNFNDANANGARDDLNIEAGLSGWTFEMPQVGDPAHPDSSISDSNGSFNFIHKTIPRVDASNLIIKEVNQLGWEVTTPQGLVQSLSFTPSTAFPFDQVVDIPVVFGNHKLPPTSTTITASEDSYTHFSPPYDNQNFNGQGMIVKYHFDYYGGKDNRKAWLKFDLPVLPSQITHATLRMYLTGTEYPNSLVDVYRHNDNNWSESTITYDNEPAHFASLSAGPFAEQSLSTPNQYYEMDVTNAITSSPSGQTITLVIVGNSLNNGASFADRESITNPPELIITTN